jgi:hypothetical protein
MNRAVMAGLLLAACASGCAAPSRVKAIASASLGQCPLVAPHESAQLHVFNDGVEWASKLRETPETVLRRPVRWADERVLLYSMGQQPNPGYGAALDPAGPLRDGGTVSLPVRLKSPAPGQMLPMVVTWPCLVVVLPRKGWDMAQVVDAQGKVLVEPVSAR